MKIKTVSFILFTFMLAACVAQPAASTATATFLPSPTLTATPSFTETPIPTPIPSLPPVIAEAQKNLGSDYMLKAAADGKSYDAVVAATGETIKNLTFTDGIYQFVGGPDKFPYTVAEQAVKDGTVGDGKIELGPWSVDVKTGKMEIHTVAVTELGGGNLPTLAIKWEKDESGKLTPETIAQIQTMFRARDEAMTAQAMSAEFADLPANMKPAGWKGFDDGDVRGTPGAIGFLPRNGSGVSDAYRAHPEWWPMQLALQSGNFDVKIMQSDGSEMDAMHLSIVAMDATGAINSYSALVPKDELSHLMELATPGKRGWIDWQIDSEVKVVEMFTKINVEEEVLSDPTLREFTTSFNDQTSFFDSHTFREMLDWKHKFPDVLKQLIWDGRDTRKWTGR